MDGWMDGWMDERMNERMDGPIQIEPKKIK
jgi:hypothetical protein